MKQTGDNLLASGENHQGAAIYARILARERRSDEVMKALVAARNSADLSPSSPEMVLQQAEKQGIAAVSDAEWRRNRVEQRKQQAQAGFREAVLHMSAVAAEYYTPEEKLAFAQLLDSSRANAPQDEVVSIWIPAAMTAGLKDREAQWRKDVLFSEKTFDNGKLDAFNLLEKQRMENTERGKALEKYAEIYQQPEADQVLALAEDAWRDEGNHARELAVLRKMDLQNKPQANLRERYFELLLRSEPNQLAEQASIGPANYADAAANYIFAKGTEPLSYAGIDARAKDLQPVWRLANTALAGLYFSDKAPAIDTAFHTVLDDRNIGERVSTKEDTRFRLAGDSWFYYGMRYGVYRSLVSTGAQSGDAEDYLASGLEGNPNAAASYVSLAQAYTDAKDTEAALREYGHALELAPNVAAVHREIADLLWSSQHKAEAIDQWWQALAILRQLVDTRVVPESFWSDFAAIAGDCHQRGLIDQLRPQMDAVLRAYIAKNGEYRSVELLRSAFLASASPSDGVDWILSLSGTARYPETLLSQLDGERWLPREQLGRILRRELELAQAAPAQPDDGSSYMSDRVTLIRLRLFQYLVDEMKNAEARAFYESLSEKERMGEEFQRARIVLAAHQGEIPKLLAEFSANPDTAPSANTIAAAASQLRDSGDRASNRLLLEYLFDFKSARHELADTDFLALAQARLDAREVSGAVELLHRFCLFSADLYSSLDSAAGLLEKSDHPAEALPFLTTLANNPPWKPEYRLRLAIGRLRAAQRLVGVGAAARLAGQRQLCGIFPLGPFRPFGRGAAAVRAIGRSATGHELP